MILKTRQDEEAVKRKDFSERMVRIEALLKSDRSSALASLARIGREGYHQEYLARLIDENTPGDYEITFVGAVILPFKPGSMLPWDGAGGRVAGAGVGGG